MLTKVSNAIWLHTATLCQVIFVRSTLKQFPCISVPEDDGPEISNYVNYLVMFLSRRIKPLDVLVHEQSTGIISIGYVLLCDTGPLRIKYTRQDYSKYMLKEILKHSARVW